MCTIPFLYSSPNKRYVKKLDEYASQMEASIQMVENDPKEGKHYLQQYRTIKDKINGTAKKSKEK